jgi:hypothetical protein
MVNYIPNDTSYVPHHVRMAAMDSQLVNPSQNVRRNRVRARPTIIGRNLLRLSLQSVIRRMAALVDQEVEMDYDEIAISLTTMHTQLETVERILVNNQVIMPVTRRRNAGNPLTIDLTTQSQ